MRSVNGDPRPVIIAIDSDADALGRTREELERRYGRDYRIVTNQSCRGGLDDLEALRAGGDRIAIVLAAQQMPEITGEEILARARQLHPDAKRALLIDWAGWADENTAAAIRRAMAVGNMDYYVLKPWTSPDELFHRTISEFLHEWARADARAPRQVTVIADPHSSRGHELRDLLARNGVPCAWHPPDSPEGSRVLREAGTAQASEPIVRLLDGSVLIDPTNDEVARGYGVQTEVKSDETYDVAIIGAGPAGLSSAVYAASEGLQALVVEREAIGGQAGSSSRIRNYLGFARGLSGSELAQRAYQQAWVFGASFLLMREVTSLEPFENGYWLNISDGSQVSARSVVLAMGVSYRRLGVPTVDTMTGRGVFYGASPTEAQRFAGGHVLVVGGGNSAGQAAVHAARYASRVSLVIRGPDIAERMSQYLVDEIAATPNVQVLLSSQVVGGGGDGRLEFVTIEDGGGVRTVMPAEAVFVLIGARPHTDWLPSQVMRDGYGFVVTGPDLVSTGDVRWPLERPPSMFETSLPGIFAVGDVRAESVKRVASAVGEGSVVIQRVHQVLDELRKANA